MKSVVCNRMFLQKVIKSMKKFFLKLYHKATEIYNEEDNLRKFMNELKSTNCKSVLDVGCGYGRNMDILSQMSFDVIGVEINEDIVKKNNDRGLKCITVDKFLNEYSESKFDVILMSHIIEHFHPKELKNFLDSYLEHLNIGGYLIIATPLESPYFYDDFDHVKPYHPTGVQMVFGGGNAQVQYYSKHKLMLRDIWFRNSPFRCVMTRGQYIVKGSKWHMLINIIYVIIFYLSFGYVGRKDGWMGMFEKIAATDR